MKIFSVWLLTSSMEKVKIDLAHEFQKVQIYIYIWEERFRTV